MFPDEIARPGVPVVPPDGAAGEPPLADACVAGSLPPPRITFRAEAALALRRRQGKTLLCRSMLARRACPSRPAS